MPDADDHLRTDHLESDLAVHSARGSIVTLAAETSKFVVGTSAMVALARLLRPDDFGLVAMALATVGVLTHIKDAGLFTATVQSKHIVQGQATALFWISAALATIAALLTLICAPAVSWFYADLRLLPITAALAAVPFLDGMTMQLQAVMTRQMRFVALSVMDAAALAIGVAAALALAAAGAGYWALVWNEVLYSAAYAAAIWTVCRWRPGRPSPWSAVRPMVAFGLHLSGFRILNYLAMNLDTVFVGRFRGPLQAGIYDRAFRIVSIPLTVFNQPLGGVAVPALSRLQGDAERYRVFYRAWIQFVFGMSMPVVAFLFVDAERAVLTILGAQWIGIVPIYRALAPAAFIGRHSVVTNWVYVSTGRTDRQLRWSAFLLVPMVIAYAIGIHWGAFGVAAAHAVVTCTLWYPSVAYCCRATPVRPRDVVSVLLMPAVASVAAGVGLLGSMRLLQIAAGTPVRLACDLVVFLAFYGLAWLVIPGGRHSLARFAGLAREAMGLQLQGKDRPRS
jgi:O-antigen/teichoic acid export membrane protein